MRNNCLVVSFENADPSLVEKLGAKGAKLVEDFRYVREAFSCAEGVISVPDGFIVSTDVWRAFHENGNRLPDEYFRHILAELDRLGERVGRRFADLSARMALIVAVRGGAPVSLPGAISSILNVGLNDEVVMALIRRGEDASFVLTTYLTAIRMYGEVVLEIPYYRFYDLIRRYRAGGEGTLSIPLLYELIAEFKEVLSSTPHPRFPSRFESDLHKQLRNAIEAVLASWDSPTALEARRSRQSQEGGISDDMGTAVVIQQMVFGNRDEKGCLSGVLFTRDQRTGANVPIIEWAPKVQCDKIVSGKLRKPLLHTEDLRTRFPDVHERLMMVRERSEARARRPLDIEFTVENRRLYQLQRRPLRMTSNATVRAMWDFVDEGKSTIQLASMIINKALEQPEKVLREDFNDYKVLARGEPITDSADAGVLVFGTEAALDLAQQGTEVVLLRKRPYGESDVAVNHPQVRGIIRYDGNTTGHEAVSAVAYSKPYLINLTDADGRPLVVPEGDRLVLNPESIVSRYVGRRVFVDGEKGILGYTEATDFLEDRRSKKKLYVDWENLREQFQAAGYEEIDYDTLLDLHYQWELELEHYQQMEKQIREGRDGRPSEKDLLQAFATYVRYIPEKDLERTLRLKEVRVDDFDFGPPLTYRGNQLEQEYLKILRALMLCTTWCTHWLHEIMVKIAREKGENENDVIRDIFLKNRTMSLVRGFDEEGFHIMKVPGYFYLILASNFEYGQDLDKVQIGPETLNYIEKEDLARRFMSYLHETNPSVHERTRMIQGEPPLGQGHARIISIGLSIARRDFDLVCRYLRAFLDQSKGDSRPDIRTRIPEGEFIELYSLEPFFAPYPEFKISREVVGSDSTGDYLITFGGCSFGEFDGCVYGKEDYENLMDQVRKFENWMQKNGGSALFRPWQFEVDPYRRHSVIAAVGIRFGQDGLGDVLDGLKRFLPQTG